jgi:hypothetical protein
LAAEDGQVVEAYRDGRTQSWFIRSEHDPDKVMLGKPTGLTVAQVLGYEIEDDYPEYFDAWAEWLEARPNGLRERLGRLLDRSRLE